MNINILLICLTVIIVTGFICTYFIVVKQIVPYLNDKNKIREKEIKNKKYELFNNVDTEFISEKLDKYFEKSVNRYIVYKFISNKVTFIGSDDTETMINDLTKFITIDISELYVFYISMISAINSQEDLIRFIKNKVQNTTIEAVSNFNKSEQIINI